MQSFEDILAEAVRRKGSAEAVMAAATKPKSDEELAAIPSSGWLSQIARGIFQAGISWQVVDAKWPEITEAFEGFDVGKVSMFDEDRLSELVNDRRVIRSGPKILAIRENASFIRRVGEKEGGFATKIAHWPASDFVGLLDWLASNGSRLGGTTGQYVLRFMGKESFILSRDVVARLTAEGVISGPATSKKALAAIQAAFNRWKDESGHNFNTISRVLAQSIGEG
ncbi:DNA-3-methyladenine glycosylase I [Thioclava sp. FR2]|uniref:DNA-3-methyladenine glycosylase I n=1 Tax=Thioclava sp. FR2 TaxID=3445780 RepID=UPI003EBF7E1F